ncbi:MAG: hypothetical protein ABIP34_21885 [Rhodoferax sp.]|uniref:hypothetical protein n=1 Tax=Rhodoferax sp. TaxID=50421 RepID=UPI003265451D
MPLPIKNRFAIFNIAASAGILCACATFSLNLHAQERSFPATALRGTLEVTVPPQVLLDGKTNQLSPGARIHGSNNMLLLSGSLVGQPALAVNYTREMGGAVSEVWVLTEAEANVKRPTAAKPWRLFGLFE